MSLNPEVLLTQLPNTRPLWLALSGGLDSMVLLDLMWRAKLSFKAIHVNHQLSPHAHNWQAHCQRECDARGVLLVAQQVLVKVQGKGLEDAARQARYGAFFECLEPGDCLVMAHHRDDQVETLLLRLMRGVGLQGLKGMQNASPLVIQGQVCGQLNRPLLGYSRQALESYAHAQGLTWVEDESNQDIGLDRNFLRHQILPSLAQRWPGFTRRWTATAEHLGEAAALLNELAELDLSTLPVDPEPERLGASLSLDFLNILSAPRAKNLMRYWLASQGLVLERVRLAELLEQLSQAKPDAQIEFVVAGFSLRRFQNRVYCLPALAPTPALALALGPNQTLSFGAATVRMQPATMGLPLPATGYWLVRTRREGERCHPLGRRQSQSLKKLLQEARLAPWLRDQLPLLCAGEAIQAVGDLWIEADAAPRVAGGYELVWEFPKKAAVQADPD